MRVAVATGFDGDLEPPDAELLRQYLRGEISFEQMLERGRNPEALRRIAQELKASEGPPGATAPGAMPPQELAIPASSDIARLLDATIKYNASDLHLAAGRPPTVRIRCELHNLGQTPLTADDTTRLMKSIASERHQQELAERGDVAFSLAYGDKARFRVSVFRQRNSIGLALRLIPSRLLSFEEIGLPPIIKDLCMRPCGLVLVTGATGSGRTMTLAAMIDFINLERADHIVTIEDPIEHYHAHKKCLVTQREVNTDVPSFAQALRRALRVDPDVVLLSEMPDAETIECAMAAAQAGHLVLGSLPTSGAVETIEHILDSFPPERQGWVQRRLSRTLIAVISQTLIPTADGKGRVAAFEMMFVNSSIKALIRTGETSKLNAHIQEGAVEGMTTLDDSLFTMWKSKLITYNEMMGRALDPEGLQKKVREYIDTQRGDQPGR